MSIIQSKDLKQGLKLGLSLLIITAIAALVLALVNAITADAIAARKEERRLEAMACVAADANVFTDLYCEDPTIDRISGAYNGTQLKGYCIEVSTRGFGGTINLMVGVDLNGSVTGVTILDHSETGGLGSKAENPEFLDQYLDRSGTITINDGRNAINAITGATITSKAVTEGVNIALTAALNYNAEGGQHSGEDHV